MYLNGSRQIDANIKLHRTNSSENHDPSASSIGIAPMMVLRFRDDNCMCFYFNILYVAPLSHFSTWSCRTCCRTCSYACMQIYLCICTHINPNAKLVLDTNIMKMIVNWLLIPNNINPNPIAVIHPYVNGDLVFALTAALRPSIVARAPPIIWPRGLIFMWAFLPQYPTSVLLWLKISGCGIARGAMGNPLSVSKRTEQSKRWRCGDLNSFYFEYDACLCCIQAHQHQPFKMHGLDFTCTQWRQTSVAS